MADKIKVELAKEQNEFLVFCNKHHKQIESLRKVGFFEYLRIGAGSARLNWNSSGQFAKPKDFNYPDLPNVKKHLTHPLDNL